MYCIHVCHQCVCEFTFAVLFPFNNSLTLLSRWQLDMSQLDERITMARITFIFLDFLNGLLGAHIIPQISSQLVISFKKPTVSTYICIRSTTLCCMKGSRGAYKLI